MLQDQRTLVITADGARARAFEEARRGGRLVERADWLVDLLPKSGDPAGHATHGHHAEPAAEKVERAFLARLCERLEQLVAGQGFDALILIAPPHALGVLRKCLPKGLHQRLVLDEARDRLDVTPETLARAVQDLRRASA